VFRVPLFHSTCDVPPFQGLLFQGSVRVNSKNTNQVFIDCPTFTHNAIVASATAVNRAMDGDIVAGTYYTIEALSQPQCVTLSSVRLLPRSTWRVRIGQTAAEHDEGWIIVKNLPFACPTPKHYNALSVANTPFVSGTPPMLQPCPSSFRAPTVAQSRWSLSRQ
jgi:hypothetical protein